MKSVSPKIQKLAVGGFVVGAFLSFAIAGIGLGVLIADFAASPAKAVSASKITTTETNATPAVRVTIYRDNSGEYRWHAQARNWKITAESGEGYKEKRKCREAAELLTGWIRAGSFEIVEES